MSEKNALHPGFKASQYDQTDTFTDPNGEVYYIDSIDLDTVKGLLLFMLDEEVAPVMRIKYEQEHYPGYGKDNLKDALEVALRCARASSGSGFDPETYSQRWTLDKPLARALIKRLAAA